MKRIGILSLLAALLFSGCVGWMVHDRDEMGRPGHVMGNPDAPRDSDAPCRNDDPKRRGERPCS
jgi:hypothetical protein